MIIIQRYYEIKLCYLFAIVIAIACLVTTRLAASETCEGDQNVIPKAKTLSSVQSLAKAGDAHAQAQMGAAYLRGQGVKLDTRKALSLLAKSAAGGDSEGQYLLGQYYVVTGKTAGDFHKAAKLLQQSADQGCLPALLGLGIITKNGKGVPKNIVHGLQMINKAAEDGSSQAQWWLGVLLITGDGDVAKDIKTGFKWIKQAADTGYSAAQISLANFYLSGIGTEPNPKKTIALLELVYAKKDKQASTAAYSLGWMYMEGKGVPVNNIKAFNWMLIASNSRVYDSEQRFKVLEEQLTKQKLATACSVYMDPLFATNDVKEHVYADRGETIAILSTRTATDMVYFPNRRLVGFISPQCLLKNK